MYLKWPNFNQNPNPFITINNTQEHSGLHKLVISIFSKIRLVFLVMKRLCGNSTKHCFHMIVPFVILAADTHSFFLQYVWVCFSKPLLFSDNSVWFHFCPLWFVRSPPSFWSPDFNPNTSLMFPDILDSASKWVEQTAESDDWCLCGSWWLPRKCHCRLYYAWSDKRCFVVDIFLNTAQIFVKAMCSLPLARVSCLLQQLSSITKSLERLLTFRIGPIGEVFLTSTVWCGQKYAMIDK